MLGSIRNSIALILIFSWLSADSYAPSVGTYAANWFHLDSSVRGIGMGRAQVASGYGVSSISDNPAHVSTISGTQIHASQASYIAGIEFGSMAYGWKSMNNFMALNLFYMNSGDMEETIPKFPDGTGEIFSVSMLSFKFTYGLQYMQNLNVGVSGRYFSEGIASSEAAFVSGLSFDIGATYKLSSPELTLGASLLNLGPNIRYQGDGLDVNVPDTLETGGVLAKITQDFPIPLTFKVGVSKEFSFDMHVVDIAFDLNKSMDYSTVFNVGSEYTFNEMVSVRLGSLLGHDTAFYALGLGCRIGGIVVDYGLSNYGIFDYTHQFSLRLEL